jgi:GNAT superfamily N-acetyltransferase
VYAWQNQEKHHVGTTYVATDPASADLVIGYYTLATSSAPLSSFAFIPGFSHLPTQIPVILLARLGVDKNFGARGIGTQLLVDALERSALVGHAAACRCVIVDSYPSAVGWYRKFGFVPIHGAPPDSITQKMFFDLRTFAKAKSLA